MVARATGTFVGGASVLGLFDLVAGAVVARLGSLVARATIRGGRGLV